MTPTDQHLGSLARALADTLTTRGMVMATAESCTGGWIAKVCTDLPGSSAWFDRGHVTYSNRAKMELLGVREDSLQSDGAVSRVVAAQMASGAVQLAGVDAAVAVTGVAGPDGGSDDKPVGTVYFAWLVSGSEVISEMQRFTGNREQVRRETVAHALTRLRDIIEHP